VRKATSQIRHLVHQLVVSIGAIELLYQLKVRRLVRVMLFESEGFETPKVCYHNQSILHNLVSALNQAGRSCGWTRPDLNVSTGRLDAPAEIHTTLVHGNFRAATAASSRLTASAVRTRGAPPPGEKSAGECFVSLNGCSSRPHLELNAC
jgi:hypothetical protein